MYKKYIKIEGYNVTDVFFEYQEEKFDGNEIFLEEVEERRHNIKGKSISNDYGAFIFKYNSGTITEKTPAEIASDPVTIQYFAGYKRKVWKELFALLKDNLFEIIVNKREAGDPDFDFDSIIPIAKNFRTNLIAVETKEEVDSMKQTAINWMDLQ